MRDLSAVKLPPLVTCQLDGPLGEMFLPEPIQLRAYNSQTVLDLLCANLPGLKQAVAEEEEKGSFYCLYKKDGSALEDEEQLSEPTGGLLIISPVPEGSGGFGKLLLGTALIAGSFFTGGTLASVLLATGTSTALTGAAEILSPQPATPGTESERLQSAIFGGNGQSSGDEEPIPLHYGIGLFEGKTLSESVTVDSFYTLDEG